MNPSLLRLVLFVSCAHALVHVYELSLPSVEQLVARDYDVDTTTIGWLGTSFRLPFGMFAIVVGFLVDRFGAKPMLVIYLFGCAAMALAVALATNLPAVFVTMFGLGMFASIYHPAGLALISHETQAADRPRALGTHGIFGSAGIGGAPFLAGLILSWGATWQQYYAALTVPGVLLGIWFLLRLDERHRGPAAHGVDRPVEPGEDDARWGSYIVLTLFGSLTGLVYAAFLTFLPRYLDSAQLQLASIPPAGMRNYLSGCVLLVGMVGQYAAGRLARPEQLERLLATVTLASAPLMVWMALAEGAARVWAGGAFALVHFMNQPIYNSLIATYVPRRRRSLCYGFSFMMTFGVVGSFGSAFAGYAQSDRFGNYARSDLMTYGPLAALVVLASMLACVLWVVNRRPA